MTSSYNKTLHVQTTSLKWTAYKARNLENLNFQSFIYKISYFLSSEFKLIEKKKKKKVVTALKCDVTVHLRQSF